MSSLVFPLAAAGAQVVSKEPLVAAAIDEGPAGGETRASWWTAPRWRYRIGFDSLRVDGRADFQQLVSFWSRHFGQLDSFLLADPEDSSVAGHCFGIGDAAAATFQLQRTLQTAVYDVLGGPYPSPSVPRTNLLRYSQDIGNATCWAMTTGVTRTASYGIAPDGTKTSTRIQYDGSGAAGDSRLYQVAIGAFVPTGTPMVTSVWLRSAAPVSLRVYCNTGAPPVCAVGASWTRFSFSAASPGTVWGIAGIQSAVSDNAAFDIEAWGPQFELASAPSRYILTTAAAVTVNPKLLPSVGDGFEPVTDPAPDVALSISGDGLGQRPLATYSRTNSLKYTTACLGTGWGSDQTPSLFTPNNAAAPDGTNTAGTMVENGGTSDHNLYNNGNWVSPVAGARYTGSVYVKRTVVTAYARSVQMNLMSPSSQGKAARYNLSGGAQTGPAPGDAGVISYGCVNVGNGWLRLWVTADYQAGGAYPSLLGVRFFNADGLQVYAGDATSTFAIWGAMIEAGYPGPPGDFIPTTTGAVSRTDATIGSTGVVTTGVAPRSGAVLTWSGSFYKRVRFEDPGLTLTRLGRNLWQSDLRLISVKP